ncbi:phosphoenolpyruvate--protein phosphotransferase [Pseudolysinimonas sp.]|uniref:phosphoenolpyruvate--protein phosphotransferase n=1 Tax=Pseudolysinimonas sp. TaxID=2680009 RepID=UPI00286AF645|nr:phosphoenolpyruvate--protein phosphotransferase [Pseudolysinimonas sp.]
MIGIVAVSHSLQLAEAAVRLALQMVPTEAPRVLVAAGAGTEKDGSPIIGTDATRVAAAIDALADTDGVLVLMDLGSAVLSAELALELTASAVEVRLSAAPFVEGLLAAVVRASGGATLTEVAAEAESALAPKRGQIGQSAMPAPSSAAIGADRIVERATLVNPLGLHVRPAALVATAVRSADVAIRVTRTGALANAASPTALLSLGARCGDEIEISAAPAARAELDRVVALVIDGFGERDTEPAAEAPTRADPRRPVGVSAGRAIGPVVHLSSTVGEPDRGRALVTHARAAEVARLRDAAAQVAGDLEARAAAARGEARGILTATALMARDPALLDPAAASIVDDGTSAPRAVWDAAAEVAETLSALGGRIAERAADVRDVRNRVVAALTGQMLGGVPDRAEPFVLVARDLAPADTATLDPATVTALVTEEGGPTSHTAIIARSLGIPAVVAATGALDIPEGTIVLVDGSTGEVRPNPDAATVAAVAAEAAAARPVRLDAPGATRDGHPVALLANIGDARGAEAAAEAGAEGVGLFRSEFLFLDRADAPGRAEQVEAYRAVFAAFPGRKVVVRTLDAGADKPLPFLTADAEENPALGVRGLRTARRRPEVLNEQLAAIAEAAAGETADVQVMAPMVATLDEARDVVARCRAVGLASAGIMIETPAAALRADDLLGAVDFVSIGTNDLTQYTMAADRMIGELADLNDPWQPAVLQLVADVCRAGERTGTPVGVCGEAAADPLLAVVFVGLGVGSLSMTPRAMSAVAEVLGSLTRAECVRLAEVALAASTASEARAAAKSALEAASVG